MRKKHEVIDGARISCWDDGPASGDRYTVVYLDDARRGSCSYGYLIVPYLGMNALPFHPSHGVAQHGWMDWGEVAYEGRGGVFKKRIKFADLPEDCQQLVHKDLKGNTA